jgi:hypothetical protein
MVNSVKDHLYKFTQDLYVHKKMFGRTELSLEWTVAKYGRVSPLTLNVPKMAREGEKLCLSLVIRRGQIRDAAQ